MTAQPSARDVEIEPELLRENIGNIAVLTLNRPLARNTLSEAVVAALREELARLADDSSIRAVVLAANGPAFSAGHDLKEITAHRADADGGRAYMRQLMASCGAMMQAILRLPQPVIAAVETTATAAGCQLVATCDLAVAAEEARFATPGVNIGLFCSTPMVALSRAIGRKAAMEMLLTGELIDAATARSLGLVNRVVPAMGLREATDGLAQQIAGKSALTVKIGKEAFYRQVELDLAAAYRDAAEVMTINMLAQDAGEGIDAFLAKRAPVWHDR
jgi:enoyl-CoA hydratase/carnithine racemase